MPAPITTMSLVPLRSNTMHGAVRCGTMTDLVNGATTDIMKGVRTITAISNFQEAAQE